MSIDNNYLNAEKIIFVNYNNTDIFFGLYIPQLNITNGISN